MTEPDIVSVVIERSTSIITALAALGALIIAFQNRGAIQQVHIAINSRMDQLLKSTGLAARAEGKEEGKAEGESKR